MAKLTDARCYEGETLTAAFATADDVTALSVTLKGASASAEVAAEGGGGSWTLAAGADAVGGLSGLVRWVAFAKSPRGTEAVASGRIYVRPLVSKWREVVEAIDTAITNWASSPNQTVTCGEISITAKTVGDLFAARDRYRALAEADEAGSSAAGGPRVIRASFGR